jgi:transposase
VSAGRPNHHLFESKEATTMVVVGADVHKRTHTFVAVDEVGRTLGEKVVAATTVGHHKALLWAREQFGPELLWGIEDCRPLSARLERDLLSAGQKVVRVAPKLMAQARASARTRGKSDPIDALAVARAVLREPDLPVACHDIVSRELKLLVDRREDLVSQRTSTINRLRMRIHELDPARAPALGSLHRARPRQLLADWLVTQTGVLAELARDELADIDRLTDTIDALAARIGERVAAVASALLALPGCGELTAAKLVAETAGVTRFKSEPAFARHAGVAPIPVWSGNTAGRVRMTRSGNRQLNAALHRIAITQIRLTGSAGHTYYRKRIAAGNSTTEALRCLKRRLARIVFSRLRADHHPDHARQTAA